jgi:hypothetical protein
LTAHDFTIDHVLTTAEGDDVDFVLFFCFHLKPLTVDG